MENREELPASSASKGNEPAPAPFANPWRWLQANAALAWLSWLLSIVLLWGQDVLGIVHPQALLFLGLVVVTFGAALVAAGCGLWRAMRGPRRVWAFAWMLVGLLPILCWVGLGGYTARQHRTRDHPNNLPFRLVKSAAASLMELQAWYCYQHRLETERLIMFYDDQVTDPTADAAAMDRHVARMEELTGKRLRAKIYWVRGRLLGRSGFCNHGVVSGSSDSPVGSLDRHELAHAVLSQHETPDTDPPTLLGEGWAVSQEWVDDRPFLAQMAVSSREGKEVNQSFQAWSGSRACLRDLTSPEWYHHGSGPVYAVGGAFVDFLIRRFGADQFLELYFTCRPESFEADCRQVLGMDLDTLERLFWEDVEGWVAKSRPPTRG
jgi:hypothetical protein